MPLESSPGARVWLLTAIEKGFVAQPGLGRVETGIRQQADAESTLKDFALTRDRGLDRYFQPARNAISRALHWEHRRDLSRSVWE
jgi:hypothetical protein